MRNGILMRKQIVPVLIAMVMLSGPVLGVVWYSSWTQFQADAAHSGIAWNVVANTPIAGPDEGINTPDCDSHASPAAWAEDVSVDQDEEEDHHVEFVAWDQSECSGEQANTAHVVYGDSAWNDLSGQGTSSLDYETGDITASPVVFFIEGDGTVTTTRVVTLHEDGMIYVRSLTMNGGVLGENLEYSNDLYADNGPNTNLHRFISPVLYTVWQLVGDVGEADADNDGNIDDYVYVAKETFRNNLTSGTCQANSQNGWEVSIVSLDMHGTGANNNVFKYVSEPIQCRRLTMSTPSIAMREAAAICTPNNGPGLLKPWPWHPDPTDPVLNPPVVVAPPYVVNPPTWPAQRPWTTCHPGAFDFSLFLSTVDQNGGNPRISAWDIDPFNLVNGKYPYLWSANLGAASNNALTAITGMEICCDGNGNDEFLPAVIAPMDNGKVRFFWDVIPGPGNWVDWTLDNNAPVSDIRSSATVVGSYVLMPWASDQAQNTGELQISWVDTANGNGIQNSAPATTTYQGYALSCAPDRANRVACDDAWITASGAVTLENEFANDEFYIGVEKFENANNPKAGMLEMTVSSIINNNPGAATYMQYPANNPPDTVWEIYSTPAIVSEDGLQQVYGFLAEGVPCFGQNCVNEANLVSYIG